MSPTEALVDSPKQSAVAAAQPVFPQATQPAPAAEKAHRPLSRLLRHFARLLNRHFFWHTLPGKWLGYWNLALQREVLRRFNLHDTRWLPTHRVQLPECDSHARVARTPDGSCNDLQDPEMGQAQTRFGRNVPLRFEDSRLLDPDPRTIADRLLARDTIKEATGLNLLAAAWIQFMVHDWLSHGDPDKNAQPIELPARAGKPPMHIRRTARDTSRGSNDRGPLSYQNMQTHWWDGSQIYGSSRERVKKLRSGQDGKLSIGDDGLLPLGEDGVDLTGVHDNWWVGLSLLHTLFAREHNAICDMLLREHPERKWTDDSLFDCARLVNAALMAKIHVLEWTATTGAHPSLELGVKLAWWGLLGERITRTFGRFGKRTLLSGIPGSRTNHHGVAYSMTEEFVAVYRMHPLIRDDYRLRRHTNDEQLRECNLFEIAGNNTRKLMQEVAMEDLWYSFGMIHPGQVTLRNYPKSLRELKRQGVEIDVAALDIVRDRERGMPRYNEFRELMHLPRRQRFEELSSDPELVRQLEEVYDNDIDRVDLMVGMYAEEPPPGFAFSDTAFRVFILMASRRLQSDRFFTTDYRPEIYTQAGMDWINTHDLRSIVLRHYPRLLPVLGERIFKPWKAAASGR